MAQGVRPSKRSKGSDYAPELGVWTGAYLVTDYFKVENRLQKQVAWRAPRSRPAVLVNLRRRLAEVQAAWGMIPTDSLVDRPGAGQPIMGPMPLPQPREPRPAPVVLHSLRQDFRLPDDAYSRSWASWRLRTGLVSRPALVPFSVANVLQPGRGI